MYIYAAKYPAIATNQPAIAGTAYSGFYAKRPRSLGGLTYGELIKRGKEAVSTGEASELVSWFDTCGLPAADRERIMREAGLAP